MRRLLPAFLLLVLLLAACGANQIPDQSADTIPAAATSIATFVTDGAGFAPTPTPDTGGAPTAGAIPTSARSTSPGVSPTAAATGGARARRQYSSPPPMRIDRNKRYTATIRTNKGTIVAQLYPKEAPVTVNNFVFLAREGFYDGVTFHRIVPGFVIQGGDPEGTGYGGPGYQFQDEPVTRPYETGSLAMAKSAQPNSNGSQFFIVLQGGASRLEPVYNHFGKVVQGMDVVNRIASTPTDADDRPLEPVVIESVSIQER